MFGERVVDRPAPGAIDPRRAPPTAWARANLRFDRERGWLGRDQSPWTVSLDRLTLELRPTPAGQLGVYPEHTGFWPWLQDAVSELRLAIKDDPNTAALWVQLSQWLGRTEDVTGAIEAAQKGIALDATSVSARLALADLYRRQRRPADAERELEQAIALAPAAQDAYLALAQQYVEQKSYDKARAVLQRLISVQPNLVQAHYLLGRVAIEKGGGDELTRHLIAAPEQQPDEG